jgi:hypothetical protein
VVSIVVAAVALAACGSHSGLAAQLPAAFGGYHRGNCKNDTSNSRSFSVCYDGPGGTQILYNGVLLASVGDAPQATALSISHDQRSGKSVSTRSVGGITYTATGSPRDTYAVDWSSGRAALFLATGGSGIPAPEALSLAAEAQAATKFS